MNIYLVGETVICCRNVKNESGTYVDPATSMKITIDGPGLNNIVVDNQAMVKDTTGKYHYDYTISTMIGEYKVTYSATDGTRITKWQDTFKVI